VGSTPDPNRGWVDDKTTRLAPLVDEELRRVLAALVVQTGLPLVDRARRNADVAMTTQGAGWLRRYDCARVRLAYGVGFTTDSYGHGAVNEGFDVVLTHGDFSVAAISAACPNGPQVVGVGFPKWAAYLRGQVDRAAASATLGIDPDRPTLLYAPTWAHRSSLEMVSEVLPDIARDWQIVVKPHHNSLHLEAGRLDALAPYVRTASTLCAQHSLVAYVAVADVVVTDVVSGAFTESFLAGTPAVGIVTAEAAASIHPAASTCAPLVTSPDELTAALATRDWSEYEPAARKWSAHMFTPLNGHDDERAASALLSCGVDRFTRYRRRTGNFAHRASVPLRRAIRSRRHLSSSGAST
jgi:hypothetical protein